MRRLSRRKRITLARLKANARSRSGRCEGCRRPRRVFRRTMCEGRSAQRLIFASTSRTRGKMDTDETPYEQALLRRESDVRPDRLP